MEDGLNGDLLANAPVDVCTERKEDFELEVPELWSLPGDAIIQGNSYVMYLANINLIGVF